MSDTAIKIENLSKQYRLGVIGTGTLSHDLKRWWVVNVMRREDPYLKIGEANVQQSRGKSDYVWALRDVNLEVKQGEVLGIIGRNGAGKSTLLKILSRVTKPTTGRITYSGRIASLLEVGTGFHPEMTGRENIFMNGSIMGMTKAEIKRKFDEIVDFAGVERYIDTPVKRYSSGMTVRLGFAVAAHLEPEILVVDEVLAVGDAEFQKKALGKMKDVSQDQSKTVLFVSHNMEAVKTLCGRALILDRGENIQDGDAPVVVSGYLEMLSSRNEFKYPATDDVVVNAVYLDHNPGKILTNLEDIYINIDYTIYRYVKELRMVLTLKSADQVIFQVSDHHLAGQREGEGRYLERVTLPAKFLGKDRYHVLIRFDIPNRALITPDTECLTFKLDDLEYNQMGYKAHGEPKGLIHPEIHWELKKS